MSRLLVANDARTVHVDEVEGNAVDSTTDVIEEAGIHIGHAH